MKRKHSIPAFFFLYHPDRDSREFAALARKEEHDRILRLRRENPFVANLHPSSKNTGLQYPHGTVPTR